MDKKGLIIIASVVGCIGIILLCVLLPISYSVLQLDQYGLLHNKFYQTLEYNSAKSESGRFFTGLYGRFVKFPRTTNLVEFREGYNGDPDGILKGGGSALEVWTLEGTNVYLEASYYFSINKEKMLDFYQNYGDEWLGFLIRLSFAVLKETTVVYNTSDFVTNSEVVATAMRSNLATAFERNFSGGISLDAFYLQRISFDQIIDDSINAKLVQSYKALSYDFQKNITLTNKSTDQQVQQINNLIRLNLAQNGTAPAITYQYEQLGEQFRYMVSNMTTSYNTMRTNLTAITDIYPLMYVTELAINDQFKSVTFLDNGVVKTIAATG